MDRNAFDTPYSDEWWFQQLFAAFHKTEQRRDGRHLKRTEWMEVLWSWFIGDPPVLEYTEGWRAQVTRDVLRMGRANLANLAVESKLDRIKLRGFRTTDPSDDDDANGPEAVARRVMKRYRAEFAKALLHASVMAEGYLVADDPADTTPGSVPVVSSEDPRQFVGIPDPLDEYKAIAAMKVFHDELLGRDYAYVLLAGNPKAPEGDIASQDRVRVAYRAHNRSGRFVFSKTNWEWDGEAKPFKTQGRGTMVHIVRAPHDLGDFEPFLDLLNRINTTVVDRLWIQKLQVFRQRAFEDTTSPTDDDPLPEQDEDGGDIDYEALFSADPAALWRLPAGIKIWESTPTDLQPVLLSIRDDIKEFAAVTRTPLYVFVPDAVQGSAEGASLAREQQVFKAETWQEYAERPFLAIAADLLAIADHEEAASGELELVWMPAERFSMNQKGDAASKAKESGVPWQGVMEDFWQAPPETVQRWKQHRAHDLLFQVPEYEVPEPANAAVA